MRSYRDIVRENVLTFINVAIFTLGLALALLGDPGAAALSVGVVAFNVVVSVAQEVRAKIVLERIALLVRPTACVLRGDTEVAVTAGALRAGDVIRIRAGDQLLADATLRAGEPVEVDESLLTGEAEPVPKSTGDLVLAGSFCVAGTATADVIRVGEETLVSGMTAGARAFRRTTTPLQRRVDTIIRGVLIVALSLVAVMTAASFVEHVPPISGVAMAIVIAGIVPNGLLLASAAAYAMSAVRIARRGVLVQQANAIDSLSHVDVLCADKTGTLTTAHTRVERIVALDGDEAALIALLGRYAASTDATDRVTCAIREACPADRAPTVANVPFSASRGWSASSFVTDGPLVLGAPERLRPHLATPLDESRLERLAAYGMRVVLFARADAVADDGPRGVRPLGLVCLREELRTDARSTLRHFADAGIELKILSGDHPSTVRAIARDAGMTRIAVATGVDVDACDDETLARLAAATTVFARVTPHHKQRIILALRRSGRYVAMVGDGVNDVLALKAAQLGIAMRSGAPSARAVADIILMNDEIGRLVPAAAEGRRILHGMRDIFRIFLTRVLYATLLIVAIPTIEGAFPFTPKQNALLTLLSVGIPSLALAAWASPRTIAPGDLGRGLAMLVLPAGWSIALLAFGTYLVHASDPATAQTALVTLALFCGVLLYVDTPEREHAAPDTRHAAVGLVMLVAYLGTVTTPLASALDLVPLPPVEIAALAALALCWIVVQRWLWRRRALESVLGLSGAA